MKVKILRQSDKLEVTGRIEDKGKHTLPSFLDGWYFNFNKHSKRAHSKTYVLVTEENPTIIEGCIILKIEEGQDHFMAYIEIAPHNKGREKKYDRVAGCLIAFACRLSHIDGNGYLAFHIGEEHEQDQLKLMTLYSTKYYAIRLGDTNLMMIVPEDGRKLIEEYLN